jgi:hypothetical protein
MKFPVVPLVMAGVVSASASGASAQVGASVIGAAVGNSIAQQQYAACVGGVTALTEKEAREADAPARALMGTYWVKTRASDKAPVTYLF